MGNFSNQYSKIDKIPIENDTLNKMNKPKLVETLLVALTALKIADNHMKK